MRKPKDHPQRGSQLIEMALVLGLLLMLLGGVLDVGRAFKNYILITNASREGARTGTRLPCIADLDDPANDNTDELRDAIVYAVEHEAADNSLSPADIVIIIDPDPAEDGCDAWTSVPPGSLTVTVRTVVNTYMGAFVGVPSFILANYTEMAIMGNDTAQ